MADFMVRAVLHTADGVPENFIQNQFAIQTESFSPDYAAITTAVAAFYSEIGGYYPSTVSQGPHDLKFYGMPGIPPNYPIEETTFSFSSAPTGVSGPAEVCICTSYQGLKVPGEPQARRRGRMYIGPLDESLIDGPRPSSTMTGIIADATQELVEAVNATADATFGVWSTVAAEFTPVFNGWVDNAWDIQRRRGIVPDARDTWDLV